MIKRYATVDLGGRALLVRSKIGGGFLRSAECRSLTEAVRLAGELNDTDMVHVNDVRAVLKLLDNGSKKSMSEAMELLKLMSGMEDE